MSAQYNILFHIIILLFVVILLKTYPDNPIAVITTLALSTVILIIFGKQFSWEKHIENKGLPGREAFIPAIALLTAFSMQAVSSNQIITTFFDKIDILLFILTLALVSYGLGKSGFFEFAAHYFTKVAKGSTIKLTISIFILAALMTYVTSNDVVVLMLTPIIFSIAVYGNIANAKQLLLAQFVAANTLSMGLLIGSPTNIIIADKLDIAFFPYFLLMFAPFIMSFIVSLLVTYIILKKTHSRETGWGYHKSYNADKISLKSTFTPEMKYWIILFFSIVFLTAIATQLRTNLLWVCIIGLASSLILIKNLSHTKNISFNDEVKDAFSKLPYSILAFGMCFFVFATAFTQSNLVEQTIIPLANQLLQQNPILVGIVGVFTSGALVNTLNDLPASALLSEIISQTGNQGTISHWILIQSILIGVNIGCYLTPIGALAGIVWFNILKTERKRQEKLKEETEAKGETFHGNVEILTPTRMDLLKYGLVHFVPVAIVTTIISALILITWENFLSL